MPIRKNDTSRIEAMPLSEVGQHVAELARSLDNLLATIQAKFERNDRHLALFSLGRRGLHEANRVAAHVEAPNAELAWSVRNLHEIDLTLRYVLQKPENLEHWLGQMPNDEKEIMNGGRPASGRPLLLGITKASLSTDLVHLGRVVPGNHAQPRRRFQARVHHLRGF